MSLLVTNVRTPLECGEGEIIEEARRYAGLSRGQIREAAIHKTSIDARRQAIVLVSSVLFSLHNNEAAFAVHCKKPNVQLRESKPLEITYGNKKLEGPIVVAGFGPAGMFAALLLAEHGYPVVVAERGGDVDTRVGAVERFWKTGQLDEETNVSFGEGGAGTFSDGKLTTRIGDPRCEYVLSRFVEFGAPQEILHRAKPHVGTDRLRAVVKQIRRRIEEKGGEIRFCTKLEEVTSTAKGVQVSVGGEVQLASALVLAIGHSARDTFRHLAGQNFSMEPKPFSVGVRIEHRQEAIDRALYGKYAGHPALPKGEYQLSYRNKGEAVYTFCMCPGGVVVPSSSEQGGVVTNGMSEYARDGENANAALVVAVDSADFGTPLFAGMDFQQRLEQAAFALAGNSYRAPASSVGRFLGENNPLGSGQVTPTYACGIVDCDLGGLFPSRITEMLQTGLRQFERKLHGFSTPDAILTGPETRTSSPVRILRSEWLTAIGQPNVYPCGEGAGYAGGIMSAAVDGIRVAQQIMAVYAPPK